NQHPVCGLQSGKPIPVQYSASGCLPLYYAPALSPRNTLFFWSAHFASLLQARIYRFEGALFIQDFRTCTGTFPGVLATPYFSYSQGIFPAPVFQSFGFCPEQLAALAGRFLFAGAVLPVLAVSFRKTPGYKTVA